MTTVLFSVLAATSLAAAGVGVPSETRSAQSLPNDHLVVATMNPASGKFHGVNRMSDASPRNGEWDHTDKRACDEHHWQWDDKRSRCHRDLIPVFLIGAGTTAGLIYALTSHDDTPSGQRPISN